MPQFKDIGVEVQLELFEPPVNADFIKDISQTVLYLLNRLFVSLK